MDLCSFFFLELVQEKPELRNVESMICQCFSSCFKDWLSEMHVIVTVNMVLCFERPLALFSTTSYHGQLGSFWYMLIIMLNFAGVGSSYNWYDLCYPLIYFLR